jgi:hypothetical protein
MLLYRSFIVSACLALSLSATSAAWAQSKPRIEKAADLPRFTYKVEGQLEETVRSAERFAPLSAALRRDTEAVLSGYDIPDAATRRQLLNHLATLDFLEGRYDAALARADEVKALQEKPADKLLSGLRLRVMAQAAKAHAPGGEAYRQAVADGLARELAALPYAVVANDIRELKASSEIIGEALILGRVREVLQPMAASRGELSSDFAPGLASARFGLLAILPLKLTFIDSFASYLAANTVAKADIWAARDVSLRAGDGGRPVRLAVWDSGVDTALFRSQLLRDRKGQPVFIAHDKLARRSNSALLPIPAALQGRLPAMAERTKGFSDLQSNIDSPQATAVKKLLSTLAPDQYKAELEELGLSGNYSHGTHVAGIALAGNPHAKLVIGRIEFNHKITPEPCPSREQALRDAAAARATVEFFKAQRVRVVNMSWSGDVSSIENELEQCGLGKGPDERKALAREYFEIAKNTLTQAFTGAPGILFVAAAGNSNNDPTFMEDVPAAIALPNVLTVGAVDAAGDEAGFTSYGPTVKVHANGYQVDSFIPGGMRVAFSGTSMAAPQVSNLAAKMLAVNARLTPVALARLITQTSDRSADGRRNLMNPVKAMAAARAAL